ncbi:cyclopropane-fatty-acyl-phospholipid synthase [Sinobacterium caligoides]|uniref:Cyclopropane-fatty-acyl-phospholipid synthase n=1 Tax=Sinobacterium caligoides TaxID=933926 RepID=A0A3N2DDN9_9GAMM|nr:cyclopropane fatty acyl phospholipid synthase [Sinobacterium caligoides]ROR97910.1 cyclopropane-fatty-acyl-phospholipid synthase [Sinobacterium caligoides]
MSNREIFENIFNEADVKINGDRPWDIVVHDDKVFDQIMLQGSIAFGEGYMDGLWDCERIDELLNRLLKINVEEKVGALNKIKVGLSKIKSFVNPQSIAKVKQDVPFHYDLGNDLFELMLDDRMAYTCAYWKDASNLNEAQEAKLDLICRKLNLQPGMRLLDIGCGWSSFMNYAAEKYGVICDGLTLSVEQQQLGQKMANDNNLPVNVILQDYREFKPEQAYDRVVSIGMIEHVGPSNYDDFFKCASSFLVDNGVFLLHTIGSPHSQHSVDPWINKYIFPNGVVPSMARLGSSIEGLLNIEDIHNFGPDYDKTLVAWEANFEKNWDKISSQYSEKFYRMWRFYLLSCAGAFRSRDLSLWQIALTKIGAELPVYVRAS